MNPKQNPVMEEKHISVVVIVRWWSVPFGWPYLVNSVSPLQLLPL